MRRKSKTALGGLDQLFRARHDYLPGTTIFREIDVATIAREMNLEELGRRDGLAEVPSSKSARSSAVENEILGRFRSYWDEAAQGARAAHESYSTRAASLSSATEIDTLVGEPETIANDLRQSARSNSDALESAYRDYEEALVSYERFRDREGLTRPPKEPKAFGLRVLILAFAAAIELGINVSTFASGDEFGLAGAMLKVIAVPLLNIGSVFGFTYLLGRHIVRKGLGPKLIGLFGLVLAALCALVINLAVAHWRDSLGLEFSAAAGKLALERALNSPWELNDINSWALFLCGLAAAFIAAIDAFIWHDPHPGFTSHWMARVKAEKRYSAKRLRSVDDLDEISADAIDALKDALKSAETNVSRRPELAKRADALAEDLKVYEATLTSAAEDLVTRYREANQRARTTKAPARFDQAVALKLPKITLSSVSVIARPGEVEGLLSTAMQLITQAHAEASALLPTLTERAERTRS